MGVCSHVAALLSMLLVASLQVLSCGWLSCS
jgi:hypothetical protein